MSVTTSSEKKLLIISQEIDPHADVMVQHLETQGVRPIRFHVEALGRSQFLEVRPDAIDGDWSWRLSTPAGIVTDVDIGCVWNRRYRYVRDERLDEEEAMFAEMETRETVSGALRMTDAVWVNHPDDVRRAESKPFQARQAGRLGFRLPRTLFTNDPKALRSFYDECDGKVVFKVMTQGTLRVMENRGIYTTPVSRADVESADLLRSAPGFFQEHVAKACDLRITVIGEQIFAAEIRSQADDKGRVDWRRGDVTRMPHSEHALPKGISDLCLALLRRFSLRYGAIDMVLTPDGDYVFLEINPSGQFGWIEGLTGMPLVETLAELLTEGLRDRLTPGPRPHGLDSANTM